MKPITMAELLPFLNVISIVGTWALVFITQRVYLQKFASDMKELKEQMKEIIDEHKRTEDKRISERERAQEKENELVLRVALLEAASDSWKPRDHNSPQRTM